MLDTLRSRQTYTKGWVVQVNITEPDNKTSGWHTVANNLTEDAANEAIQRIQAWRESDERIRSSTKEM